MLRLLYFNNARERLIFTVLLLIKNIGKKNYLNAGTGYAWAGHNIAKLTPILRSIPDHFMSPDNVGALALTGS